MDFGCIIVVEEVRIGRFLIGIFVFGLIVKGYCSYSVGSLRSLWEK